MKYSKITRNKSSFANEIHIFWLSYDDIKVRDTFVYKHILTSRFPYPHYPVSSCPHISPSEAKLAEIGHRILSSKTNHLNYFEFRGLESVRIQVAQFLERYFARRNCCCVGGDTVNE